jgi:RNA polymerase sigma-70 factor (ECF subfamily)
VLNKRYHQQRYTDYNRVHISIADNSTEQWLEFEELKDRLLLFVAELPEKCRLAYRLSRDAGYSQKRIAEEMGISEKTVEAHLSKALKTLRTRLSQFLL